MAITHLVRAEWAHDEASQALELKFGEMVGKVPFVIEQLNDRINKAAQEGSMFVVLTKEEIESVPDTKPEVFVQYLKHQGYTLLQSKAGEFAMFFSNPMKD